VAKMTPVVIPHESVNDESVTLLSWQVANGEEVKEGQPIASIETSKAVMEINASATGFIQRLFQPGEDIVVGGILCRIYEDASQCTLEEAASSQPGQLLDAPRLTRPPSLPKGVSITPPQVNAEIDPLESESAPVRNGDRVPSNSTRFSKQAAELLMQHQLEPALFAGRGLVRTVDILEYLGSGGSRQGTSETEPFETTTDRVTSPTGSPSVAVRTEKLSRRKRAEVNNLASAYRHALVSNVSVVVPTRGLRAAAAQHPEIQQNVTAVIIFETARLLRKYPHLNAFYADGKICFYEAVNIGFAVDGGRGLKVLMIRDADSKGIAEIAVEMQELLVRYLNDDIPTELLEGGTFTVTDLSGEGVFSFHPLLSQWQSAILGIGGEFFVPGTASGLFNLVLSFDHQVSEGRQAAQFLSELRQRLQYYEEALRNSGRSHEGTEEPHCFRCLRPAGELQEWGHFLLLSVKPDGTPKHVCSICLQGM
jgi:pyruvate/2-oxoglutarate dehydrogenase complex dihydrolipoamide acyltransferase (E2) component